MRCVRVRRALIGRHGAQITHWTPSQRPRVVRITLAECCIGYDWIVSLSNAYGS